MLIDLITREDLNEFRNVLLNDLKQFIQPQSQHKKEWLKSSEVRKLLNISAGTLQNLRINGILDKWYTGIYKDWRTYVL